MALPPEFAAALDTAVKYKILDESQAQIQTRIGEAVKGALAIDPGPRRDLGAREFLSGAQRAIYREVCDPQKKALKEKYATLLNRGTSKEGVAAIASTVLPILTSINPAFAAPSLVILVAVWLLKVGVDHWCSSPPPGQS